MQATTLLKSFILSLTVIFFVSCEESGEPLTLEDIYDATYADRTPFKAKINGFDFTADVVAGGKQENTFFIIGAQSSTASITIKTLDITPGLYLGEDSSSNSIFFKNDVGREFSSTYPNIISDASISIRSYSKKNSLATGVFSGTLYSLDSKEVLEVSNGEFNSIPLDIPFLGEMTALVNNTAYRADQCSFTVQQNGGIVLSTIASTANLDTLGIRFIIEDTLEAKNYDLEDQNVSAIYNKNNFSSNTFENEFNSTNGNIIITEINPFENRVFGTFNFEARNVNGESVSVQSGAFEALIN